MPCKLIVIEKYYVDKSKKKSPGSAIITNHSQSLTREEEESDTDQHPQNKHMKSIQIPPLLWSYANNFTIFMSTVTFRIISY